MPFQLVLTLEYQSDINWRWALSDAGGSFVADQEVALDPSDPVYESFVDLPGRLRHYEDVRPAEDVLAELGAWMGEKVFGAVGEKLLAYAQSPACVVRVRVPPAAQNLLFRPFELAHIGGKPLAERGFRFIYTVAHEPGRRPGRAAPAGAGAAETLRVLGVFSLPRDATPLNLRQERYRLQQLTRRFVQTHGLALELRLLQYGATRQLLADVLQEAPGWDVMHFSGHGLQGELVLEKSDGTADSIDADELAELLRPAAARLKLLTLSACYSGAADLRAARAQVGLETRPMRETETAPEATGAAPAASALPSLGQRLAEELNCAVLAMRYPVLDDFATELALTLYDRLLEKRQPLPQALQLALSDALNPARAPFRPDFSRLTPLLFGERAADLSLQAPPRPPSFAPPPTGLFDFPPLPKRFVGRLMPMLRARQALAPESGQTGVLFYGMAGAGKTACALELAHGYDPAHLKRFTAFVWHKAPEDGHDIADALTRFALSMENQLPGFELIGLVDNPEDFKRKALPRLRRLLQDYAILLVLDNLEGLLTPRGDWRDPRWGDLLKVLLDHDGLSRLVLTSRHPPNALAQHARLQSEAIHALGFQESVLLARQLPHLKDLFKGVEGREILRRILRAAQGHPKLLELADGLAADPAALEAQLARDEAADDQADAARVAFFESGHTDRPQDAFVRELRNWTEGAAQNLPPTARLLALFLARLEEADRVQHVVHTNWEGLLRRLAGERGDETQPAPEPTLSEARAALSEPGRGLETALTQLAQAGLIEVEIEASDPRQIFELTAEGVETLLPILFAQNPEMAALLNDPESVTMQSLAPYIQAAFADPANAAVHAWLESQVFPNTERHFRLHPGVTETLLRACPQAVLNAADKELADHFVWMFNQGMRLEMQGGGALVLKGARHAVPYLLRAGHWEGVSYFLEKVLQRDTSPETLALAIPLLRRTVEKTRGTDAELSDSGLLASTLIRSGRYAEAETTLRELIDRILARGDYRLATTGAGELFNLFMLTGRFQEALQTVEEIADYTRRAGLGPWTQLSNESNRLQALEALGRYQEVLTTVEQLRARMKGLPEASDAKENISPWAAREYLLNNGRNAARELGQWDVALELNAEILEHQRKRGAAEFEIAKTRFNDYDALLHLQRYREARDLLEYCRAIFEQDKAVSPLGNVYGGLADLEEAEGRPLLAARFMQTALRYVYWGGDPDICAICHGRLARYLENAEGAGAEAVLAHRLAEAVIRLQISPDISSGIIHRLARSPLPPEPPSFEDVCDIVEQIEGVRFRELFARLPKTTPDGEAAVWEIWERVKQAEKVYEVRPQVEALLAGVPEAVRTAFFAGDEKTLNAVIAELEPAQQQAVGDAVGAASRLMGFDSEEELERRRQEFWQSLEPIMQAIAAAAHGDEQARAAVEELLPQLEENGWQLTGAVRHIWAGERDAEALTAELDESDAAVVQRVLELLKTPEP